LTIVAQRLFPRYHRRVPQRDHVPGIQQAKQDRQSSPANIRTFPRLRMSGVVAKSGLGCRWARAWVGAPTTPPEPGPLPLPCRPLQCRRALGLGTLRSALKSIDSRRRSAPGRRRSRSTALSRRREILITHTQSPERMRRSRSPSPFSGAMFDEIARPPARGLRA